MWTAVTRCDHDMIKRDYQRMTVMIDKLHNKSNPLINITPTALAVRPFHDQVHANCLRTCK